MTDLVSPYVRHHPTIRIEADAILSGAPIGRSLFLKQYLRECTGALQANLLRIAIVVSRSISRDPQAKRSALISNDLGILAFRTSQDHE